MELLPAIDLIGAGAVRLVQGDFSRRSEHGDPVELAERYLRGGARWVHVVDLDAARTGTPVNRDTVHAIVDVAHRGHASVEVGGGIRTEADVDAAISSGIDRVVLGTAALEEPELAVRCAHRHPGRVAVGVDYRRRPDGGLEPASRGWLEGSGVTVSGLLGAIDGAPIGAVVVTAIERDGTLQGPDIDGLAAVLDATAIPVVASGGVGALDDLVRLAALRGSRSGRKLAGAVVGKALVNGTFDVEEAIAACEPSD